MASQEAEALKDFYKNWTRDLSGSTEISVAELRVMSERWGDLAREPAGVDFAEVDVQGVPCMWATPAGGAQDRVILCTHGGGYVLGSMYSHRKMFGHIAKAVGCRALILNYRRAPENPHPAPVEDAVTAYRWLLSEGIMPEHIATTGDSAGGGLCTSMLVAIRDKGLALPAAAMPISPWYDMEGTGETLETNADADALVQRPVLEGMAALFLGSGSRRDPLANALLADVSGLPPIYIQVGADETLLDDSVRFAKRAQAAGVEVKLDIFPEMQHVFQFLAGSAPEADEAIGRMGAWVRPKLGLD